MPIPTTRERRFIRRDKRDEVPSRVLEITRVTRVAAGGKHMTFRVTVAVGDQKGKVGVGIGKGLDVAQAIEKATRAAKKNMIVVPIVDGTIPHQVKVKFGPSELLLKPQRQGRGLVAGGVVRVICELAGIKDISAKFLSSTNNKMNNAKVTMEALQMLRIKNKVTQQYATPPAETQA
ncbi:MAG: small subunit ribosomal protein S5 [Parcubacteria group bacterium Greene0714_21]|nr:MAG: small subunit ribosomal protein S5 [Parcubacteria group bacterium Greene0416_39]TSC97711.1 MAG: small subunit ribosomal protein S5 [Parcubacteria group bacterium Greene1014_47]TSD04366.1 MAG: small subunit ribosomal protein S5 [Parcubacteria group bacterium Greene0714_21]